MSEEVIENKTQETEEVEEQQQSTVEKPENKSEQNEKTLKQSEVDEIIAKRLERERKKFEDYDALKSKLSEFEKAEKERKEAEMSEIEKAQAKAEEEAQAKSELERQLEEMRNANRQEKINNEFFKVATGANIPSDRLDDALKLADLSAVEVGDEGVKGVAEAVAALVENKPWLAGQQKPRQVGESTNHNNDAKSEKTAEQILEEAADKARRTGRVEDRMAYNRLKRELGK